MGYLRDIRVIWAPDGYTPTTAQPGVPCPTIHDAIVLAQGPAPQSGVTAVIRAGTGNGAALANTQEIEALKQAYNAGVDAGVARGIGAKIP